MPNKPKKTKKEPIDKVVARVVETTILQNKLDAFTDLIASLSGQIQNLKNQVNNNWTRFVFHDHRRMDLSGPQFFNEDYRKEYDRQQRARADIEKAQAEAQARARGEQGPPKPPVPPKPAKPTTPPPSEK